VLGLSRGRLDAFPTTAYLLTYLEGKCTANCGFCSQARESRGRADALSRVTWPAFATKDVLTTLADPAQRGPLKRVCIQALNHPQSLKALLTLVRTLKQMEIEIPLSISCQPLTLKRMERFRDAGVDRIGIPLDAATEGIFERVKGHLAGSHYTWKGQHAVLLAAVEVFGKGRVSTHLIVGLGETEQEMVNAIQWCVDEDVCPALFSFTPLRGTALGQRSPPTISHYRRVQLARFLMVQNHVRASALQFDAGGCITDFGVSLEALKKAVRSGLPFITSGCPGCNRPYYNERPGGPLYNYPVQPTSAEISEIGRELELEKAGMSSIW
jgi:biotin synthase-related radical SAM superfamily protein